MNILKLLTPSCITSGYTVGDHFRLMDRLGLPWWYGLLPYWCVVAEVEQAVDAL